MEEEKKGRALPSKRGAGTRKEPPDRGTNAYRNTIFGGEGGNGLVRDFRRVGIELKRVRQWLEE